MTGRILLVDNALVSYVISNCLRRDGYEVDAAESLKAAQENIEKTVYGLAIISPYSLLGPHPARENLLQPLMQNARRQGTPIIVLSDLSQSEIAELYGLREGEHFDRYLGKMVLMKDLMPHVQQMLQGTG